MSFSKEFSSGETTEFSDNHNSYIFELHFPNYTKMEFNVALVGGQGAGKTKFVNYLATGIFAEGLDGKYKETKGFVKTQISVNTDKGFFTLNIYDIGHNSEIPCDIKFDGFIVMFCMSAVSTALDARRLIRDIGDNIPIGENVPIVVCGNNDYFDNEDLKTFSIENILKTLVHERHAYYDVSAKKNMNVYSPLMHLLKIFIKKPTLCRVACVKPEKTDLEKAQDELMKAIEKYSQQLTLSKK